MPAPRRTLTPAALARKEAMLDAYAAGELTKNIIADFNVSWGALSYCLRQARERGDPRGALRQAARTGDTAENYGRILDLWADGVQAPDIRAWLGVPKSMVGNAVTAGRARGDPRAVHRNRHFPSACLSPGPGARAADAGVSLPASAAVSAPRQVSRHDQTMEDHLQ